MKITQLKANPLYFSSKTVDAKPVPLTIQAVEIRKINDSDRVVVLFKGEERDLKLTSRQVTSLSRAFGDETDAWIGKTLNVSQDDEQGVKIEAVTPETK